MISAACTNVADLVQTLNKHKLGFNPLHTILIKGNFTPIKYRISSIDVLSTPVRIHLQGSL